LRANKQKGERDDNDNRIEHVDEFTYEMVAIGKKLKDDLYYEER
jgi:hypothetical protein